MAERSGESGLESASRNLVFNSGMSVIYNKVYVKGGCLWIACTSCSGQECTVAVGTAGGQLWGHVE